MIVGNPDACDHVLEITPNVNKNTREVLYECAICHLQEWR